ncbi:MAG: hypothetical protein WBR18_09450 [Anaerolineales bacterium]
MKKRMSIPSTMVLALALTLLACGLPFGGADGVDPEPPVRVDDSPESPDSADAQQATRDLSLLLPTATSTSDPSAFQQSFHITGDITAALDGERRAWHTGWMEMAGEDNSFSDWYRAPLGIVQDLYSFELFGIPAENVDGSGGAPSGATLSMSFNIDGPQAGQPTEFTFENSEGVGFANVEYRLPSGDMYERFTMTEGQLAVTVVSATPGEPASLSGTFEGTMTSAGILGESDDQLDPSRVIQVSDGEFSVESLRYDPSFDQ